MKTTAEVRVVDGIPEVFVDGKLAARSWARADLPGFLAVEKMDQWEAADVRVILTALDQPNSLGWDGRDGFSYAVYEEHIARLIKRKPDIRLILYVGFRLGAPYNWCRDHMDELARLNTGLPLQAPSWGSMLWREQSGAAFSRFVAHFESGPYADHIIGYNPIWTGNEWYGYYGFVGKEHVRDALKDPLRGIDDYSEPMLRHFRAWLHKTYGGDLAALRESWRDARVTFDSAPIPTIEQRFDLDGTDIFPSLRRGNQVADYYRCYHEAVADMAIGWARAVKETLTVPKLCGMMHAYTYCTRHAFGHYNNQFAQLAAARVMDSPYIDYLHSPYGYYHRCFPGVHYSHHAPTSLKLRGKIFLDQIDTKTHLRHGANTNAKTPYESEQVLKRDVAHDLSHNAYYYWQEIAPGVFSGYAGTPIFEYLHYEDPGLQALIQKFRAVTDQVQALAPQPNAEVALFTAHESDYYRKPDTAFGAFFVETLRSWRLALAGAPFEDYMLEDFPRVAKGYKVYLFPNALYVPKALRESIQARLQQEGATAVWFYAPGYLDEQGGSLENCRSLTGLDLARLDKRDFLQLELAKKSHPLLAGIEGETFGTDVDPAEFQKYQEWLKWPEDREDYQVDPLFVCRDPVAEHLGTLRGTEGGCGFAVKKNGNSVSVFLGAPNPPTALIRNILKSAGVHLYSEQDDLIYANSRFVAVMPHGPAGERRIKLPGTFTVTDPFTGGVLATASNEVSLNLKHGETTFLLLRAFKAEG